MKKEKTFKVTQGNDGTTTHQGLQKYAVDFKMPVGTQVLAARDGVIHAFASEFEEGKADSCFDGKSNYVRILHSDGTHGFYGHLLKDSIKVKMGQTVHVGDLLALSGNSGNSSGPHLHFEVQIPVNGIDRRTLPVLFNSKNKKGFVPKYGELIEN